MKEQALLYEKNHLMLQVKEQARLHKEGMQRRFGRRNGPLKPELTAAVVCMLGKQAQETLHAASRCPAMQEKPRLAIKLRVNEGL